MTVRQEFAPPRVESGRAATSEDPTIAPAPAASSGALSVLTLLLEKWSRIALTIIVVAVGVLVARLIFVKQRYEANATLMTVASQKSLTGVSGVAALSMLTGQGLAGPSPDLVARTLKGPHVLVKVGLSPVDSSSRIRIIDRLRGSVDEPADLERVRKTISRVIDVSIDRKTGLLDVVARHSDSALVRLLVTRVVDYGATAFSAMMRAQATAQREGQEARVKLTAEQLREAEAKQLAFLRANRISSAYSVSALEQQAIDREIQSAMLAYQDAISAREAAFARELEETPAVVVVDSVPPQLPKVPKYHLFYSVVMALLAAFGYATILLVRHHLELMRVQSDPRAPRFIHALRRVPILGRLAPRE